MKKLLKCVAALTAAALTATAAQATIISSGSNNPLNFSWSHTVTGTDNLQHTMTGNGSLSVSGFSSASLTVNITLNNTSTIGGQGGERLTVFGFGIDPDAANASFSDPGDSDGMTAASMSNFPGFQNVDVCGTGGNNCAGGGTGGIFGGASDTFSIILGRSGGGNWGTSVDIAPLALKYQTGYGSFEFSPCIGRCGGTPPNEIPLPGTLLLVGMGLAGLSLVRRRA